MTLDLQALIELQRDHGLGHVHVIYLDSLGFHIAHTDAERRAGANLAECPLHVWLEECDESPEDDGVYTATSHEPDTYSEPYGAAPWDLERFDPEEA